MLKCEKTTSFRESFALFCEVSPNTLRASRFYVIINKPCLFIFFIGRSATSIKHRWKRSSKCFGVPGNIHTYMYFNEMKPIHNLPHTFI